MPDMNGFVLCTKILKVDVNVKICFMSAGEINHEAVREIYPTISIGCFIKKACCSGLFGKESKSRVILVVRAFHRTRELTFITIITANYFSTSNPTLSLP
jgi:hypothetical protein